VPRRAALLDLTPDAAAEMIATRADEQWVIDLLGELEQRLRPDPLRQLCSRWDLSNAAAARMFGVSRQAFSKWLEHGPPPDRSTTIADLAAATDLLAARVHPDRIPAIVRRPADDLDGATMLELAHGGRTAELVEHVRSWLDVRRVQP
jgi:hypothetical protein